MQLVDDRFVAREVDRDEMLRETLVEWYARRPSLRDVSVTVFGGVATLRGRVTTNRDRALAVELALDAGADEVQDELMLTWPLAA
jgi:osmotically-inducible protein OsmY